MHLAKVSFALLLTLAVSPAIGQDSGGLTTAVHSEEGEYLASNGCALYLFKADRQGVGG
jgi:hypothetical protein